MKGKRPISSSPCTILVPLGSWVRAAIGPGRIPEVYSCGGDSIKDLADAQQNRPCPVKGARQGEGEGDCRAGVVNQAKTRVS